MTCLGMCYFGLQKINLNSAIRSLVGVYMDWFCGLCCFLLVGRGLVVVVDVGTFWDVVQRSGLEVMQKGWLSHTNLGNMMKSRDMLEDKLWALLSSIATWTEEDCNSRSGCEV